jgi:bla regulator protein BlaR1
MIMLSRLIGFIISEPLLRAVYWTLIHSLWQGLILAMGAALSVSLTRRASAKLRYNLLALSLVIFLGCICATFIWEGFRLTGKSAGSPLEQAGIKAADWVQKATPSSLETLQKPLGPGAILEYFNDHASFIVCFWLFMVGAQLIRLGFNLRYLHRLRNYKTHPVPEDWIRKIQELATALGIRRRVTLLESEIARAPMMTGFLKPVILFPFSLILRLPADQVEAVLLHELAHVRRMDFAVNLIQHLVDTFFFFNPGILWLSSLLRRERENCCDDVAIRQTGSRTGLVKALIAFQEYRLKNGDLAVGFPGRRPFLLDRIKRIITNHNQTLNTMEKTFLFVALSLAGLFGLGFSGFHNPIRTPMKNSPASPVLLAKLAVKQDLKPNAQLAVSDTTPEKKKVKEGDSNWELSTIWEGKKYRILEKNDQLMELSIDGERIPEADFPKYLETVNQIKDHMKEEMHARTEELRARKEAMEVMAEKLRTEAMELKNSREMHEDQKKMTEDGLLKGQLDELNLQTEAMERKNKREMYEDQKKMTEEGLLKGQLDELKLQTDAMRMKEEALMTYEKEARMNRLNLEAELMSKNKRFLDEANSQREEMLRGEARLRPFLLLAHLSKPVAGLVSDLMEEGIIRDKQTFSIKLNKGELIVNGVKQPKELQEQMAQKYLKGPKDHIHYSVSPHSTSSDVYIE